MFRWLAPLLLFAGKPDVLVRIITLVVAGAILAFGVWLLSNVALTFDALKNPYVAAIYAVVLSCFLVIVGTVTWLRFRRLQASERRRPGTSAPVLEAPPLASEVVSRRAQQISDKWARDSRRPSATTRIASLAPSREPQAEASPPKPVRPVRGALAVTGPSFSGKTALIAGLVHATDANPPETSDIVRLVDAGPADGEERDVAGLVAKTAATDGVLFVVDQDLRAPEVAAIKRLAAGAKPLYVVLNKADQFSASDRDAILVSIRAKLPAKFAAGHVVSVASAPSPVEREIEDARGAVRVELRRPAADVRALTSLLAGVFAPAPGRTLRFEA